MGMGSCFYAIAHGNEVAGCWEIVQFPTPSFSTDFGTGHGIIFYTHACACVCFLIQVDIIHVNASHINEKGEIEVGMDMGLFYHSVEWDVMSVPARNNTRRLAGSEEPFREWIFTIYIRRKFLFYTTNLIIPLVSTNTTW